MAVLVVSVAVLVLVAVAVAVVVAVSVAVLVLVAVSVAVLVLIAVSVAVVLSVLAVVAVSVAVLVLVAVSVVWFSSLCPLLHLSLNFSHQNPHLRGALCRPLGLVEKGFSKHVKRPTIFFSSRCPYPPFKFQISSVLKKSRRAKNQQNGETEN